jgi:hypothetical protein
VGKGPRVEGEGTGTGGDSGGSTGGDTGGTGTDAGDACAPILTEVGLINPCA